MGNWQSYGWWPSFIVALSNNNVSILKQFILVVVAGVRFSWFFFLFFIWINCFDRRRMNQQFRGFCHINIYILLFIFFFFSFFSLSFSICVFVHILISYEGIQLFGCDVNASTSCCCVPVGIIIIFSIKMVHEVADTFIVTFFRSVASVYLFILTESKKKKMNQQKIVGFLLLLLLLFSFIWCLSRCCVQLTTYILFSMNPNWTT